MKIFLMLKHWQLFGLLLGIPMIFQFISLGAIITSNDPTKAMFFFPIIMVLFVGLFFSWFYTLGTNFHKKLPLSAKMNLTKFKIFLFIPVAYMLLISVFMVKMFSDIADGGQSNPAVFALIVPLHLFSMFCIFYCLHFNAKALKSVELGRPVTFNDFSGEFFLLWFFPLGVWFLQPRINKIFADQSENDNIQITNSSIF